MTTVHDSCVAMRTGSGKYLVEIVVGEAYGPVVPDADRLRHWCDVFHELVGQGYFFGVYQDDDIHPPTHRTPNERITSMEVKDGVLRIGVKLDSQAESVEITPEVWEHFRTERGIEHLDVIASCSIEES